MADLDAPSETVELLDRTPLRSREEPQDLLHSDSDNCNTHHTPESIINGQTHDENSTSGTGILVQETGGVTEEFTEHSSLRKDNVLKSWCLEILMLVLASGLLLAIFYILSKYNGEKLPDWDGSITLNAVVAIMATVFRASLAYVSFEILAQEKWGWISTQFRPMRDVQYFDDASRGVYGSLRLLPVIRFRQPRTLGAIVVAVFSLASGTFLQQTIQSEYCYVLYKPLEFRDEELASICTTRILRDPSFYSRHQTGTYQLSQRMRSAMLDSIVNPTSRDDLEIGVDCSADFCDYPVLQDKGIASAQLVTPESATYASLGVCSHCKNVTQLIEGPVLPLNYNTSEDRCAFELPTYGLYDSQKAPVRIELSAGANISRYMSIRSTGNLSWIDEVFSHHVEKTNFEQKAYWSLAAFSLLTATQTPCSGNSSDISQGTHISFTSNEIYASNPQPCGAATSHHAAACVLYPCVRYSGTYVHRGTVYDRVFQETPLRQQGAFGSPVFNDSANYKWKQVQQPCSVDGIVYTSSNMSSSAKDSRVNKTEIVQVQYKDKNMTDPEKYVNVTAPQECVFELPHEFVMALRNEIDYTFNTDCEAMENAMSPVTCKARDKGREDHAWYLGALISNDNNITTTFNFYRAIESIATRITVEMAKAVQKGGTCESKDGGREIVGLSWEETICIKVVWVWLTLPIMLLLLSIALLSWVIMQEYSSRDGLMWKNSLLPFLLRDYPGIETMGLKAVERLAKGFKVKIEKEE